MIEEFHNIEPYSLSKKEKNQLLTRELTELTTYHREHCEQYDNILSAFELNEKNIKILAMKKVQNYFILDILSEVRFIYNNQD